MMRALENLDCKSTGFIKKEDLKRLIEKFSIPLSDDHFKELALALNLVVTNIN